MREDAPRSRFRRIDGPIQRHPVTVGAQDEGRLSESIVVATVPTEELTADQRTSIIDVCIAAHNNEDFKNLFTFIPSGGRHFIAYRGSDLVSHAVVTTRWLKPASLDLLNTAFVDAVATQPEYQSQGYASAVMRRLAADVVDYEIACLQTDSPEFYERLEWELWRGPLAGRTDNGLVPTPDQRGVMILRLPGTPPLDLDSELSIEQQPSRIWE
jgi:aminoglycoside 2'-N-acetyltransferase I